MVITYAYVQYGKCQKIELQHTLWLLLICEQTFVLCLGYRRDCQHRGLHSIEICQAVRQYRDRSSAGRDSQQDLSIDISSGASEVGPLSEDAGLWPMVWWAATNTAGTGVVAAIQFLQQPNSKKMFLFWCIFLFSRWRFTCKLEFCLFSCTRGRGRRCHLVGRASGRMAAPRRPL